MEILLNGQQRQITGAANLKDIIDQFSKNSKSVIVELNGTIIKNDDWSKRVLKDSDILELINFVGGG